MPLLFILLLLGVLIWMWWNWPVRSKTHDCRWRENRRKDTDAGLYLFCINCGAETISETGARPRTCLRDERGSHDA